jgi:hypothetical protein
LETPLIYNRFISFIQIPCGLIALVHGKIPPNPRCTAAAEGDFESHDCPAALVKAAVTTWYVDKASLADYTPK